MQRLINLAQTPFIDLRNKKNTTNYTLDSQTPSQNLPKNEDQMEFKIYKNFTKFDETKYWLTNPADQKIISEIIQSIRDEFRLGLDIETSKKFKELALKHVDTVVKYLDQENPQIAFIALRAQLLDKRYKISQDKALKIAKKTLYPSLLSQFIPILFMSAKTYSLSSDFCDITMKAGLAEGFLWKGIIQTRIGNQKLAYQLLKNAELLGFQPIAYKYLGQLFMSHVSLGPNLKLADKYFKKAKQSGAYIEPFINAQILELQEQKQKQKLKFNLMKSTEDTQSVQLSNYIGNKMQEFKKNPKNQKYQVNFGTTNNMVNRQSTAFFNQPKTFYVVFSPLMNFPGRHFLVKDTTGSLQYISIYNWDQIAIEKLRLLHELGTKIVLNQYIRKLGAGDQLPFYRVDNPHTVQFYKRTQKHIISDKQLRNYAKNLFQRNLIDKAMNIYQYMIMKGSQQMQIIYSNMGVIHQRKKNTSQAVAFYEKSLKIKKYNKSQMRLANIYIKNKLFDKAQKIINEIESEKERQQFLKQILKLKQKQIDAQNFNKVLKNKHQIKKQIYYVGNDKIVKQVNPNPSFMVNIREDRWSLVLYKQEYEKALNVKSLPQESYLDLIQSVYNSVENKQLKKQNVENFFKMTEVAYRLKYENQLYPYSAPYLAIEMPLQLNVRQNKLRNPLSQTILFMCLRQNYLQNRIEDLCLQHQQKGQYKEAEQIYRLSGNYCIPFNVKVAQMMFMQGKNQQCEEYCIKTIQYLNQFTFERYFKYIAELAVWHLKSLIRLKKNDQTILIGEQYIKEFTKKSPHLLYENYNYQKKGLISFKQPKNKKDLLDFSGLIDYDQTKQLKSAEQFMRNINQQIIRAYILKKQSVKARQYLPKVLLKKESSNFEELIESYYQSRLLQYLVIKLQNINQAIKQIDTIKKQINNDKKLNNKQPFIKFLLKEKLSLLIETQKLPESIKQSQQIVKINKVNLIFVKNKLFQFVIKKPQKVKQLLDKIKSSEILNCLWGQLLQKSTVYFQRSIISNKEPKLFSDTLLLLEKLDLNQEPQYQQDENPNEQNNQLLQNPYFDNEISDEKFTDFNDELQRQEYENQICRFKVKNGVVYIVIFDQSLQEGLEVAQYNKFVCAADHLCLRQYGSTGIKIQGSEVRLKIRKSSRLTGKLMDSPADPKVKFCFFNKRQKHDDYKRHNNK